MAEVEEKFGEEIGVEEPTPTKKQQQQQQKKKLYRVVRPKQVSIPQPIIYTGITRGTNSLFTKQKSVLISQDLVDYTPDPEKRGEDVIVIHAGSRSLRVGLASRSYPRNIPHVIARKMPNSVPRLDNMNTQDLEMTPEKESELAIIDNILKERQKGIKRRFGISANSSQAHQFNENSRARKIPEHNDPTSFEWTDVKKLPEFIVGEKALNLPEYEPYQLFWPIQNGQLNEKMYSSLAAIASDLEIIWISAIEENLKLSRKDFGDYHVVLIIPDMFIKKHVKIMVDVLLKELTFKAVIVHQESCCSCLGAGMSSGCVVDVGAQKAAVSCVEEGFSTIQARRISEYGGEDITSLWFLLLKEAKFPIATLDLSIPYNFENLNLLKELHCTFEEFELGIRTFGMYIRNPRQLTLQYELKIFDEAIKAPLGLFHPNLFGNNRRRGERIQNPPYDPEDCFDYNYLVETIHLALNKNAFYTFPQNGKVKEKEKDPLLPGSPKDPPSPSKEPVFEETPQETPQNTKLIPLDELIINSIMSLGDIERQKKMFSSIVLVGGSTMFPHFSDVLKDRMSVKLPAGISPETLHIRYNAKDVDPRYLAWKGGAVLCKLESAREAWISKEEWRAIGIRALKEKAPFSW